MSANPLNSAQFTRLLDRRLRKVFQDKFAEIPTMKENFYNILATDSAFEEFFEIGTIPDIPEFNGKLSYLSVAPGYYNKIEPKEFAGGLMFERKLLDDKKYPVMDNRVGMLTTSAIRVQEKYAARPFYNAFSASFDFQTSEEGVALCSTGHLTKSGTPTTVGFSNAGTAAMSKTSINATRILMRRFRNDVSERIDMEPDLIICPDSLYDTACECVGYDPRSGAESQLDPDSGQFKINSARAFTVIPWLRLDDYTTKNWYMVDRKKMKQHLLWVNRVNPEFNMKVDFDTFSIKNSVYFRIATGFTAWQWIYGQAVT
jgi:phage major head subunit gpT-like protein